MTLNWWALDSTASSTTAVIRAVSFERHALGFTASTDCSANTTSAMHQAGMPFFNGNGRTKYVQLKEHKSIIRVGTLRVFEAV